MRRQRAYCPSCDTEGRVGRPCQQPICRARGIAYIPSDHYAAFRERPAALRDRRIGSLLGGVLLVERLSRGAFGQLYLGLSLPLLMPVAVKVFDPIESSTIGREELSEMFDHEARALAALSHPNVVRLLAFDAEHDPAYLVMEYVEGSQTLRHLIEALRREGLRRLAPRRAERILSQVLWALAQAHARGVVHLDLRPDNIGIEQPSGYEDFVRLLDFGLATHLDEEGEARGFGTPQYIAPERIVGGTAAPAADLYAVGVMTYELLLGRSPFGDRDPDDVVAAKRDPAFDPAAELVAGGYPAHVIDFFREALARDPARRFADANAFLARLRSVADYFDEQTS